MPFKVYSAGRVQQLWLLLQLVSYWLVGCHGGQCLAVVYYLWTEQWTENIGRCGFYICACRAGARKSDFQQKKEIKFLHLAHLGFVEACQLLFTKKVVELNSFVVHLMQACCVCHLPLFMRWGLGWAFVFFVNLVSLTVSTPDKASDGTSPKKGSRGNLIGQGWNKERWRAQLLFEALQKRRSTNIGGSSRHSL